jgi:hypothetical protein
MTFTAQSFEESHIGEQRSYPTFGMMQILGQILAVRMLTHLIIG